MITIDVPREWLLTSNVQLHWAQKAPRVRWLRTTAKHEGQQSGLRMYRAHLTIVIEWPKLSRIRDRFNLAPTVKALVDGFVDAGVIPDDDDLHLLGPDLRTAETTTDGTSHRLHFHFKALS